MTFFPEPIFKNICDYAGPTDKQRHQKIWQSIKVDRIQFNEDGEANIQAFVGWNLTGEWEENTNVALYIYEKEYYDNTENFKPLWE